MSRFRHALSCENLEGRVCLSAVGAPLPSPIELELDAGRRSQVETIEVSSPGANGTISLVNRSDFETKFTMTFIGRISVNVEQLVEQIRSADEFNTALDHRRAFFYLRDLQVHDYPLTGHTWMHEPSLYLNSFGAGFCDDSATALSEIWNAMGYSSRIWLLQGHVVSEVLVDGRWEMYDADLGVFYFNREGLVAGVEELATQPELISQPTNPVSKDPYVYRGRMAEIYRTQEDNRLCAACSRDARSRDLVFALPAGGRLEWGDDVGLDVPLPAVVQKPPTELGLMRLVVPGGFVGSLDIPLAIYDVRGSMGDWIGFNNAIVPLQPANSLHRLFTDSRTGDRMGALTFDGNTSETEVLFFFNPRIAELLPDNRLEILQLGRPAELRVNLEGATSHTHWEFVGDASKFMNNKFIDISSTPASKWIVSGGGFAIAAAVQPTATNTRRPIVDAHRFSLEIDTEGRPYAYFRSVGDAWSSVRGQPLAVDRIHDLLVRYDNGLLQLSVDGQLIASRSGPIMDPEYPVHGPYIGRSDHLGGLYFEGEIHRIQIATSVRELSVEKGEVTSAEGLSGVATNEHFANPPELRYEFAPSEPFEFVNSVHFDLSDASVVRLFEEASSFAVNVRARVDEQGYRRPILDAYRFAIEIDADNRPYVYYRGNGGRWYGLRGEPLAMNSWHDISVRYDHGTLSMLIDGLPVGQISGTAIDYNYPMTALYLGKSDHLGGMYFDGDIYSLSISGQVRGAI